MNKSEKTNTSAPFDNNPSIKSSKIRFLSMFANVIINSFKKKKKDKKPTILQSLTHWHIELDYSEHLLIIKKRNWFLIGVDTETYNFGKIRNIKIDEHILTADIFIKVYAGSIKTFYFRKSNAKDFRDKLMKAMQGSPSFDQFIDTNVD